MKCVRVQLRAPALLALALLYFFADGRMLAFRLYSVSVRNLGTQQNSLMESWYRDVALSCCPSGEYIVDIRQVYPVDFYAESIDAEWAAVYGRIVKETAGRTRK